MILNFCSQTTSSYPPTHREPLLLHFHAGQSLLHHPNIGLRIERLANSLPCQHRVSPRLEDRERIYPLLNECREQARLEITVGVQANYEWSSTGLLFPSVVAL